MNYLELASMLEDSNYLRFPSMAIEAAGAIRTLTAERDALKQQRDDLLEALKYAASCLGTDGSDPIDMVIASVKEKQNDSD